MIDVFDIIGPDMIGPSSSHTAGAVRIGRVARELLQSKAVRAKIGLYGSFDKTGRGHGTHMAIVAGILGMMPNDPDIAESFTIARQEGLALDFYSANLSKSTHPNTAVIFVESEGNRSIDIQAASVGGGKIRLDKINNFPVNISDESTTILVKNNDKKGVVAEVSAFLASRGVNIATFELRRDEDKKIALMSIKIDGDISREEVKNMEHIPGVISTNLIMGFRAAGSLS